MGEKGGQKQGCNVFRKIHGIAELPCDAGGRGNIFKAVVWRKAIGGGWHTFSVTHSHNATKERVSTLGRGGCRNPYHHATMLPSLFLIEHSWYNTFVPLSTALLSRATARACWEQPLPEISYQFRGNGSRVSI